MRHELHLLLRGLRALGIAALAMVVVGLVLGGAAGAASAAVAVGVVGANHAVAALSTGWARTLQVRVLAVGYGAFLLRMLVLLFVFLALSSAPWIHREVFAGSFVLSLMVALAAECISYVRKTYVPSWRLEGSR